MKTNQHQPLDPTPEGPEKLLTTDEVAAWLGIKSCTLEKARSTRLGDYPPFIRLGRVVRYRRKAVEAWLNRHAFNIDGSRSDPDEHD